MLQEVTEPTAKLQNLGKRNGQGYEIMHMYKCMVLNVPKRSDGITMACTQDENLHAHKQQ